MRLGSECDDLEREALEEVYRPPPQRSAAGEVQRFPVDEHLLNALQEVEQRVHTVVIDARRDGNSGVRFFRGGLKQPLR